MPANGPGLHDATSLSQTWDIRDPEQEDDMSRHPLDQGHAADSAERPKRFSALDRIKAGEGQHPAARTLARRRKGPVDPARVKQYLRIERGYLA